MDCSGDTYHRIKAYFQKNHHARMMMDMKSGDILNVGTEKYSITNITSNDPGVSKSFEFVVTGDANESGTGRMDHGLLTAEVTETIDHRKNWLIEDHKLSPKVTLSREVSADYFLF